MIKTALTKHVPRDYKKTSLIFSKLNIVKWSTKIDFELSNAEASISKHIDQGTKAIGTALSQWKHWYYFYQHWWEHMQVIMQQTFLNLKFLERRKWSLDQAWIFLVKRHKSLSCCHTDFVWWLSMPESLVNMPYNLESWPFAIRSVTKKQALEWGKKGCMPQAL